MPLHPQTPLSLASFESRLVLPFWYWLTYPSHHGKEAVKRVYSSSGGSGSGSGSSSSSSSRGLAQSLQDQIGELAAGQQVGPLYLRTDGVKATLAGEARSWTLAYGRRLNAACSGEMDSLAAFVGDLAKRLSRAVNDLDDIRWHMAALSELREAEVRVDLALAPIEDAYALLARHALVFNDGNAERVDSLAYAWRLLRQQVCSRGLHGYGISVPSPPVPAPVTSIHPHPLPYTP